MARSRSQATIPASVAARVAALETALEAAPSDDAVDWLDCLPHTVLAAVDRRHRAEVGPGTPRRRFSEIAREAPVALSR